MAAAPSMSPAASAQEMQAEAQVTAGMLKQLPQAVQKQIEQAVNEYRQQLTDMGQTDDLQMLVWRFYTQCVKQLHQEHAKKSAEAATAGLEASSAQDVGAEQHDQTSVAPQASQWEQIQQARLLHQQMQMQQGYLRPRLGAHGMGMRPGFGTVPGIIRPTSSPMVAGFGGGHEAMCSGAVGSGAGTDKEQQDASMQDASLPAGNSMTGTSVNANGAVGATPLAWNHFNKPRTPGTLGSNGLTLKGFPLKGLNKGATPGLQQGHKGGMTLAGQSMMGGMSGCKGQGGAAWCKGGMAGCKGGMAGKVGGLAGKGPAKAGPQFPPALQRWLKRLFESMNPQSGETRSCRRRRTSTCGTGCSSG
ncbi:unnamed protein product [Prorocentrum cordatum]|uniref:Uncharacterized protein n=1 Tax=Prorocentrum cordatum TaxID=2364126 RepID=A0ABN9VK51_9DINO|nr:unnamed protein product [Polarella glacialis]